MSLFHEFYTVKEVAAMLHCNPQTVRKWIREGKIEDIWDGKQYLISKDEYFFLRRKLEKC